MRSQLVLDSDNREGWDWSLHRDGIAELFERLTRGMTDPENPAPAYPDWQLSEAYILDFGKPQDQTTTHARRTRFDGKIYMLVVHVNKIATVRLEERTPEAIKQPRRYLCREMFAYQDQAKLLERIDQITTRLESVLVELQL